jgi:NTE family protein
MNQRVRCALALGAGGARGYAHIGVIEVLEERDIEIVNVAGSSMGALVGGLYAAGKLDAYTDWVTTLSHLDVLRLLDVSLTDPGMIRAEKVFARMRDLLDGVKIEDLPIPFTAVATDLLARKPIWFQRGPVETAVRASIAMPGVFTPLMLNGRVLVDGGLMDPVPVAPTASAHADVTIAVDLGGDRVVSHADAPARETAEERPIEEWTERFRRGAANLFDLDLARALLSRMGGTPTPEHDGGQNVPSAEDEEPEAWPAGLGRFDVMNQSLEAMQRMLTRYRLAGDRPDVLITVPKDACRTLDFHRASDMIALGRELTFAALDRENITTAPS